MKITLVTCFNADWQFGPIPRPYIPLNLLCLGACLQKNGHQVQIVDQAVALMEKKANHGDQFQKQIAEVIYLTSPDVVGFTTMCNSYPQTLSLARQYGQLDAHSRILLGGPQATGVDVETLKCFPWIDVVVRGEADQVLPEILDQWEKDRPLDEHLLGITWRDKNGDVQRNASPPLLQDLDLLPYPAYDLYSVEEDSFPLIPIEAGRGCPFDCSFCSTNLFFSRRYRIKSPDRLISEMDFLHKNYGFTNFDLVHDMLTVDQRWVRKFSRALIEGNYSYRWSCSARVDCVDSDLLAEMGEAGCAGIFFGVETGSQRLQPVVKKKLNVSDVLPIVRTCLQHKIFTTTSFITGFPDETVEDALDSLNMALDVLHLSPHTRSQMHLLAPLVGSPLYAEHKDELEFAGTSSDLSHFFFTDEEVEMIRRNPDIFPNFYYIPTPYLDRDFLESVSSGLYVCSNLLIALRHAGMDLKDLLEDWVIWQSQNVNNANRDRYENNFGLDFSRYLREKVVSLLAESAPYLSDMVDYFETKYELDRRRIEERIVFRQFRYDVLLLNELCRTDRAWPSTIEPESLGILFINLAFTPERGIVYLEIPIPNDLNPLVKPGDDLEIPRLADQLKTRPNLIICNKTQKRVFTVKHHMTPKNLQLMGLVAS